MFYGTGCLVIKKSHADNLSGAEREKEIFLIPSTFFVNNGIKMAFFFSIKPRHLKVVIFVQLEELRADIVDLKEMYREQINLLVNQV